jgi:hypothetical protein
LQGVRAFTNGVHNQFDRKEWLLFLYGLTNSKHFFNKQSVEDQNKVTLAMATQTKDKKLDLIQWLSTIEDEAVLDRLLEIREKEVSCWWSGVSEKERQSIAKGIDDAEKGNLKPHSEARKIYEKWL